LTLLRGKGKVLFIVRFLRSRFWRKQRNFTCLGRSEYCARADDRGSVLLSLSSFLIAGNYVGIVQARRTHVGF
jgi:hypothetical protein